MAKPTRTFGAWIFGKVGSVRPDFHRLPNEKTGQEIGVAQRFVEKAGDWIGAVAGIKSLDESDHDFMIQREEGRPISVQCTEIVYRDFLLTGDGDTPDHVLLDGETRGIDCAKRDAVIAERIRLKLEKHYSKPSDSEFWLLIWSVTDYPLGNFIQNGVRRISAPISAAQELVRNNGVGPFDKIFYFNMQTRPDLIWSLD